ncbi:hypothetical protein IMY05_016G0062800 [Salix suchowensis]|nr:hypothetical protein IMY05_016G0062800 [Salix suchowensis]
MSDSKFFDDAKGDCSDENIGDRSDAQNQELVGDQISDPNQPVDNPRYLSRLELLNWNADAANTSPLGLLLVNANTFLAEENINLKFQCGRMKRDQKRLKRSLDGEKEKGIELAEKTENLSKILLMGPEAQLRERIAELEASYAQLRERNTELEASNAQLRERNAQLENGSNERVVDKENDHELGQARN